MCGLSSSAHCYAHSQTDVLWAQSVLGWGFMGQGTLYIAITLYMEDWLLNTWCKPCVWVQFACWPKKAEGNLSAQS